MEFQGDKPSSRVLKPPGGGHSNIFESPEAKPNPPRPKYNQQNSSNLNAVMGTVDPNLVSSESSISNGESHAVEAPAPPAANNITPSSEPQSNGTNQQGKVRVPPGGFSSGLW